MSTTYLNLKLKDYKNSKNMSENILKYFHISDFIKQNLKHELRPYQISCLENYNFLINLDNQEVVSNLYSEIESINNKNNQHLFQLATGAGKTLIMASNILQLYELGYRKFIFTTNKSALIDKTKKSLLPSMKSSKCEFKDDYINYNSKKIKIYDVINFSNNTDDIEIIFTTIHSLHTRITETKENVNGLNELKDKDLIILADEAHHFQASSKSKTGENDILTWENSINTLLNCNPNNKIIELTATMDIEHKNIADKYKDKLVFDYNLKQFRRDGYSKEINLVVVQKEDDRIMLSILINFFKHLLAADNNIKFTPKMVFQSSGTIQDLNNSERNVINLIKNFSLSELDRLFQEYDFDNLNRLKNYLLQNTNKLDFISILKKFYSENSSLVVHSKDTKKEEKLQIANSLDDNYEIKMVFMIDVLTEGWDVLSLFEVVKLDTVLNSKKTTTKDKQLIGRGTRIPPFFYKDLDPYKRKFEEDLNNNLRLLEEMSFFSANDNNYINSLKKELIEMGISVKDASLEEWININPNLSNFGKELLKNGVIYSNYLEDKKNNKINLYDLDIIEFIRTIDAYSENLDLDNLSSDKILEKEDLPLNKFLGDDFKFILKKVLNKYSFFSIDNLKKIFGFTSKSGFINELINCNKLKITLLSNSKIDLKEYVKKSSYEDIYSILTELFNLFEKELFKITTYRPGSKEFKEIPFSEVFQAYKKKIGDIPSKKVNNSNFLFDKCSFDSTYEEEYFKIICGIKNENILFIRNSPFFKFFNYKDGRGFEPDFICFEKTLDKKLKIHFNEVKGEHLIDQEWKEEFLINLKNNFKSREIKLFNETYTVELFGSKFFGKESIKEGKIYFTNQEIDID